MVGPAIVHELVIFETMSDLTYFPGSDGAGPYKSSLHLGN